VIERYARDPRRTAAVVYDDGVAIDDLLLVFARELADRGVRVGGVLQVPKGENGCGPEAPRRVRDLATGEDHPICWTARGGPDECGLDPGRLRLAAARVRAATASRVDLVFVSRFGKEEARGLGFLPEMSDAVLEGVPLLTAVRRSLVDRWLSWNDGLGTLLEARLWVLREWWGEVGRVTASAAPALASGLEAPRLVH
jgi:molybdate transport system ATP-binding protein